MVQGTGRVEVFHRDDYYVSIIASEACKKSDQFPGKTGECLSFEILPEGSGNGEEIPENEFLDNAGILFYIQ